MSDCPNINVLQRLFDGCLSVAEQSLIEAHAERCVECQQTLHELSCTASARISPNCFGGESSRELLPDHFEKQAFLNRLTQQVLTERVISPTFDPAGSSPLGHFPVLKNYILLEEIGRGATGTVYRARQRRLNRSVAVKVISTGSEMTKEARKRFQTEVQAIAHLRHPNIVQVFDADEEQGYAYLALELVEGKNLEGWLGSVPRPAFQAAKIVETLAGAVDYAHRQGIVHRDLKPANVLLEDAYGDPASLSANGTRTVEFDTAALKIADFGLAKVLPNSGLQNDSLTQDGAILGTPAYLAPEQTHGNSKEVGPAADIYSLGAILYTLLCGRPPFQGSTSLETLLQVVHHEPVPITRLVPSLPRDLNTICLKCLEKSPAKRYLSAAELASDLARFRRKEPIRARPVGYCERTLRWARRKPAQAAAICACLLLGFVALGGGFWLHTQQLARERAMEADLHDAAQQQRDGNWVQADAKLARVELQLGNSGPSKLRSVFEGLNRDRENHEFLLKLENVRLDRANVVVDLFIRTDLSDREYTAAFREAGYSNWASDPAELAQKIAKSQSRDQLLAAIDDWASCISDPHRQMQLMEVATRVDSDPWRDRVRDPQNWKNPPVLLELAKSAQLADQSVQLLVALGERLQAAKCDSIGYLQKVQKAHPSDFWANYALATALANKKSAEAIGYFRAALAIRPNTAAVYNGLGNALRWVGRVDEAIEEYKTAVRIDPNYAWAYASLGGVLKASDRLDEAVEQYRKAVAIDPEYAWGHYTLANALRGQGRFDEAIEHYRRALQLDLRYPQVYDDLGYALQTAGRLPEAIVQFQAAVQLRPNSRKYNHNLACALLDVGKRQEAIDLLHKVVQFDPKFERSHATLGEALLSAGRFQEAIAEVQIALSLTPANEPVHTRLANQLNRCQLLATLEPRLSALLAGQDKPADTSEILGFAELCYIKQQYEVAAQLYSKGFAEISSDSSIDTYIANGFTAARAATKAAADGALGAAADPAIRSERLQQAGQWLQASLDAWAEKLDVGPKNDRPMVQRALTELVVSPDLALLRDQELLDSTSPAIGQQFRELWRNLDAELKRSQEL